MLMGILGFRFAHRIETSEYGVTLFGHKKEWKGNDIVSLNKQYSRYINVLAILCFVCGVLFAYISNIMLDAIVSLILILIGSIIMVYGYKKTYK